jgi:hypothetical protein
MKRIFNNITLQITVAGLVLISVLIGSCNTQKIKLDKKNLIPEEELVSLLVDIYIADGLLSNQSIKLQFSSLDSITTYYQVIEKHGYTKEIMDKTMQYYFIKDSKKLNKIYDQVLGILSEMEARVQKDYRTEQIHLANLWPGKDFYAMPSIAGNDSAKFDITNTKFGTYTLSFTSIVYPDDQTVNPAASIYLVASDSLKTGKRIYFKPVEYMKDGRPHLYTMVMIVPKDRTFRLRGSLFDFHNLNGMWSHFLIENVVLTLKQVAI